MKQHQKTVFNDVSLSFDYNKSNSLDLPFIALRLFSLLTLQVLDGIKSYPDKKFWDSIDSKFFVYCVSCISGSLITACETFNCMNKPGMGNFSTVFSQLNKQADTDACLNIISCGCLWLSSISTYAKSILQSNCSNISGILNSPLGRMSECMLRKVTPVALYCLKSITNVTSKTESSNSCLYLCLALIRSVTSFSLLHRDIKKGLSEEEDGITPNENIFGGIDDEMLMSINLDESDDMNNTRKGNTHEMREFLLQALDQSKVCDFCDFYLFQ